MSSSTMCSSALPTLEKRAFHVLRTMVSSHARASSLRRDEKNRRARTAASCTTSSASPSLESQRWLGTYAAVLAIAAACTTGRVVSNPSPRLTWAYRAAVFCAAGLVGVAGHFGAVLVWGADFLRP